MCCCSSNALERGEGGVQGEDEEELLVKKKKKKTPTSAYFHSSFIFTLSSFVSFVLSVISCKQDGFTTANVGSMIANLLYLVGYALYLWAEWKSPSTSSGSSSLPLMNSEPKIQHM